MTSSEMIQMLGVLFDETLSTDTFYNKGEAYLLLNESQLDVVNFYISLYRKYKEININSTVPSVLIPLTKEQSATIITQTDLPSDYLEWISLTVSDEPRIIMNQSSLASMLKNNTYQDNFALVIGKKLVLSDNSLINRNYVLTYVRKPLTISDSNNCELPDTVHQAIVIMAASLYAIKNEMWDISNYLTQQYIAKLSMAEIYGINA